MLYDLCIQVPVGNGSMLLLESTRVTHGTPKPECNPGAWRIGVTFASNKRVLSRAVNIAKKRKSPTWLRRSPQVRYRWHRFLSTKLS